MSEDEDLELQALQRQLDDAFQTTRPRAGFEDRLWAELQVRRPWWQRVRGGLASLPGALRRVPAAPAAAVAALLVVAIGVGIVSSGGLHLGGGGSTASLATRDHNGATQFGPNAASGSFGPVPAPAPSNGSSFSYPDTSQGVKAVTLYTGPATLVWAGHLDIPVSSAPVFRFGEPTAAEADRFALAVGASPQGGSLGSHEIGRYSGDGFAVVVRASTPPSREPYYTVVLDTSRLPAAGSSPMSTADSFLSAHGLSPGWPHAVVVDQQGNVARVNYLRQFAVPGYTFGYLVDPSGTRYGLEVQLQGGRPVTVSGPLPLSMESADYHIISADQAARSAVASSRTSAGSATPSPTVTLTGAELVYVLVWAGDHSFYEPAYLLSGMLTINGVTLTKRVLVPAVDPSQLSS